MKTSEQDIARMARQLCDEENQQLHVRPTFKRARQRGSLYALFTNPLTAAIPAAMFLGFLVGQWTNSHSQTAQPLTALTDTVYITVRDTVTTVDTVQTKVPTATAHEPKSPRKVRSPRRVATVTTGQPIMSDHIRYDLLVKN